MVRVRVRTDRAAFALIPATPSAQAKVSEAAGILFASLLVNTPVMTGFMKAHAQIRDSQGTVARQIGIWDVGYVVYVNSGHRVVSHGKTHGWVKGQHFIERSLDALPPRI